MYRMPGMGEPGGLLSMGSHRVGHAWSDLAAAAATAEYSGVWDTALSSQAIVTASGISQRIPQNMPEKTIYRCQDLGGRPGRDVGEDFS